MVDFCIGTVLVVAVIEVVVIIITIINYFQLTVSVVDKQ